MFFAIICTNVARFGAGGELGDYWPSGALLAHFGVVWLYGGVIR